MAVKPQRLVRHVSNGHLDDNCNLSTTSFQLDEEQMDEQCETELNFFHTAIFVP